MPPRALKLLPKILVDMVTDKTEDIILYKDLSSILSFGLARAKDVKVPKINIDTIFLMPKDTVSILQANSRTKEGLAETLLLKSDVSNTKQTVVLMSDKLLDLITALEIEAGCPIKVVFAKRKNNNIFLCHKQSMTLPVAAHLKILSELLDFSNRTQREKILRQLPADFENIQMESFVDPPKGCIQGSSAYPGLMVVIAAKDAGPMWIFVAEMTSPADVAKMKEAKVIITGGGLLSHAALLAASEGIPCVVGVSSHDIAKIKDYIATWANPVISVDAYAGKIWLEALEIASKDTELESQLKNIVNHSREFMEMAVYANADTPEAIQSALNEGADGIGLLRTEHMYQNQTPLLSAYLKCAMANDTKGRREVLAKLMKVTRRAFREIFEIAGDSHITVRLLDAPLAEFGADFIETNPMMGLRGCRFGILFSDFYAMQVQALAEGYKKAKASSLVGIMFPLITEVGEVVVLRDFVRRIWEACGLDNGDLAVGVMLETPRACLIAGELAPYCDFLSYGTNDLTQFTFAMSRDDMGWLPNYTELGVLDSNPFQSLDARGVGRLMDMSASMARMMKPDIKLGICGHHAGDSASIQLVQEMGFDYISCTKAHITKAVLAMVRD